MELLVSVDDAIGIHVASAADSAGAGQVREQHAQVRDREKELVSSGLRASLVGVAAAVAAPITALETALQTIQR